VANPFLGEIRVFPFNFAPVGWAFCDGSLIQISQNTALFSLLGTTYGGDGVRTFALPNLQGRVAMGRHSGVHELGESAGEETHTLTASEMPVHQHDIGAGADQNTNRPGPHAVAARGGVYTNTRNGSMAPTDPFGGSQPHNNLQPYTVINFCIATQGIFPSLA
jgi:microcystin-dependent protein